MFCELNTNSSTTETIYWYKENGIKIWNWQLNSYCNDEQVNWSEWFKAMMANLIMVTANNLDKFWK